MSEKLSNHENQEPGSAESAWDTLKNVSMNEEPKSPETELTSPSEILDDVSRYAVKEGKVYLKETGQEENDEDLVLRVKTSKFLFNEARALRDRDSQMLGERFVDRGPDYYVDKMMDRYGLKDENTEFAEGKMLKELIDNGGYHQTIGSNDLMDSKFGMFVGKKADFGEALLRRRLRQRGLEMGKIELGLDTSTFDKNGYSTVDIEIDTKPLAKNEETKVGADVLHHPAAEQLSQLEAELAEAHKEGDEGAIRGYEAAIKMTVERNRLEVSPEDFDGMSDEEKERFYRLKMKEEKVLGDKEAFDFWNANLQRLGKK